MAGVLGRVWGKVGKCVRVGWGESPPRGEVVVVVGCEEGLAQHFAEHPMPLLLCLCFAGATAVGKGDQIFTRTTIDNNSKVKTGSGKVVNRQTSGRFSSWWGH